MSHIFIYRNKYVCMYVSVRGRKAFSFSATNIFNKKNIYIIKVEGRGR